MAPKTDPAAPDRNLPVAAGERRLSLVGGRNTAVASYEGGGSGGATPPLDLADITPRVSRRWIVASFVVVVLLPVMAAWYFLTQYASDRYAVEFRVAVRSTEAPVISGMGDVLGLPGNSGASYDAQSLVQYLKSRAILADLEGDIDLRAIYGNDGIDGYSRLPTDAPVEQLLEHWNTFVKVSFEGANNTVVARVVAFEPQDALALSQALLTHSTDFVNRLSDVARQDAVAFARREIERAEGRLSEARLALAEMQDREALLDPEASASATLSLAAKLREKIADQRATLATQQVQLGPDTWPVRKTLDAIAGLEAELARVEAETTVQDQGPEQGRPLSAILREYQTVRDEVDFAQRAYESALSTYEAARLDADRKQIYLATIVTPGMPEEPSFPKPLNGLLMTAAVAFALWLIGLIGAYAIRDHM